MLKYIMTIAAVSGLVAVGFVSGCDSEAKTDALIGTGLGVGIAALTGGDGSDLMIGAAIGGGAGYIWGNEADKKKAEQTPVAELGTTAQQDVVSVWVTNSNGSKTEVRLRKTATGYMGPKGEVYSSLPTEDELRPVYGF